MTEDEQARNEILAALQAHRQAALGGDTAALEASLDPDGPHYPTFKSYFLSQAEQGYNRYDLSVQQLSISLDRGYATLELDAVIGIGGFVPLELRYTFVFRRSSVGTWLLFNLKEFRLHLIAGFHPSTLDRHPLVIAGSSESSRSVADDLVEKLDTTVIAAAEFGGSWNDVVLIDCGGDNPVADRFPSGLGVTTWYGDNGCHRWATVVRGTDRNSLQAAGTAALGMIVLGQAPPLPDSPNHGDSDYLRLPPIPSGLTEYDTAWFDAARRATDPAEPSDYARAVLKWYRFLLQDAILDPAIVLANMMSERQAVLAGRISGPRPELTLRNLATFTAAHLEHQERKFPDPVKPWGTVSLFPVNPSLSCDEMLAFYPDQDKAYGMCGPLQYFNLAVLRLSGQFNDQDLVQIRILGGGLKHEVLCMLLNDEHYLCSGTEYIKMKDNFYRFSTITHVFNERFYRGSGGQYNMSDDSLDRTFSRLIRPLSRSFQMDATISTPRPQQYRPELIPPRIAHCQRSVPDPRVLAARLRNDVFEYSASAPQSHCTYAKYAYQTLYVRRPEAYAIASSRAPLANRQARRFSCPNDAVGWIEREIRDGGIFAEDHRIQHADQVMVYRRGTPKDRAMLGWCFLTALGIDSYVVVGHQNSYLAYSHDGENVLFDMRDHRRIGELPEMPVMLFNQSSCYFPLMGRNDVDPRILNFLNLRP